MPGRSPARVLGATAAIFLLVGLSFTVVAGVFYASTVRFLAGAEQATGTVVALSERTSTGDRGRSRTWAPVVQFTAGGQTFEFEGGTASNPPAYDVGDPVTVVYDPADPADARIAGFVDLYLMPVIFGSIGVSFALTGGIIGGVLIRRHRRRAWLRQFGRPVAAEVVQVELKTNVRIGGRHPYVVHAAWRDPASGQERIARSPFLGSDPRPGLDVGHQVRVLVDPDRPARHMLELPDSSARS